jgi:hypothetical protein
MKSSPCRQHSDQGVGYGRPPAHSRFRKGQSGNPRGRPRGARTGRTHQLVLQEAFRTVTVREGEKTLTLPAIQAVIRSAIALAAKGNGPAQRAFIDMMRALEQETNKAAEQQPPVETAPMTDLDKARRIAFILSRGQRELERRQTKAA